VIEVRGLVRRFGETTALDGMTFAVPSGSIAGFLGPNGAGKTTTLRILATCLAPHGGSATVAGFDVVSDPMEVRRRIGYLPELPPLHLDHTVLEYLRYCAALRGVGRSAARRSIDDLTDRCGLGDVRGRLLGNLSKGYRQRVGLAQALVHDPEVLVLDEPTSGLDPNQIVEIRGLIRSLAGERTILLSTHILPEVAAICGRAVIVDRGRVRAEENVDDLQGERGLESAFLQATLGSRPPADPVEEGT
jgi:ABC-2 type transport system ATP-binding protein